MGDRPGRGHSPCHDHRFAGGEDHVAGAPATIERAGVTGRAKARTRTYAALLKDLGADQLKSLDGLSTVAPDSGLAGLAALRTIPAAAKPDHVREILDQLRVVRNLGIDPVTASRVHPDRLAREGPLSPLYVALCSAVHVIVHLPKGSGV